MTAHASSFASELGGSVLVEFFLEMPDGKIFTAVATYAMSIDPTAEEKPTFMTRPNDSTILMPQDNFSNLWDAMTQRQQSRKNNYAKVTCGTIERTTNVLNALRQKGLVAANLEVSVSVYLVEDFRTATGITVM